MSESAQIIPFARAPDNAVQQVAPYEARLVARTQQWRVAVGERVGPRLHALRARLNEIDHDLTRRLRDLLGLEAEIEAGKLDRFMPPFGKVSYLSLVAAMLLLEMPVNKAALDFLRLPERDSYMVALFFALVNFVAAKCTARVFRQEPLGVRGWRAWAVAVLTNTALLSAIYMVGQLRRLEADNAGSSVTFLSLQLAFYMGTLFLSFLVIPPSLEAEQANRRRDAGKAELDGLWKQRERLARVHNQDLEKARLRLLDLEADAEERVAEYRDGNMRFRTEPAPSWFRQSVGTAVWRPLDLGHPVDEHPATIGELIARAREGDEE